VPVSVVRALGARVVIAVNLNTDPFDPVARRQARSQHPSLYVPTPQANRSSPDIEKEIAALIDDGAIATPSTNERDTEADDTSLIMDGIKNTLSKLRGSKQAPEREIVNRALGSAQRGPGFASVLLASLNIIQDRLARARLASDPPDIVIAPRVGHLSLMEFDRASEMIRLGEEAAEEALPSIREAIEMLN
jgi:NTE family protein